jgi:predicted porin
MMDKGIGFHVGPVDLSFSGEVNAFYVHDMPDKGPAATTTVAGGLASTGALHSEAIRSGLLPGNFNIKLATKQEGYDIGVTFGFYPGLSSVSGVGGANSAGNPQALGTSGIDFRQQFITVGNERIGTLKMGRDIGLFGQEAILNDFTLLSVGTPSANAAPSNTSLGRIGLGYVYTDFIPQFTYTTPSFAGLQAAAGVFTPLNAVNFSTLSGTLAGHDQPQIQAKLAYAVPDGMLGPVKAKLWTNVVTQNFQASAAGQALPTGSGTRGWGVDYGAKLSAFGADVVAYGYNGDGLGSTALFFDAVDAAGHTRDSRGYYLQGTYTLFDRLLIGASYGQSHLSLASGEVNPLLFKYNESEVFGIQYKLTDWLKFVTEYTHTHAKAQGGNSASSDAVAAGSILFF